MNNLRALTVAFGLLVMSGSQAASGDIIGTAGKISDGDTLWVCDQTACHKIGLCGIDAPELNNQGGKEARAALQDIVTGRTITCTRVGEGSICDGRSHRTSGNRIMAQCFVDDVDVADELIEARHACDWVQFSGGHYSRGPGRGACRKSSGASLTSQPDISSTPSTPATPPGVPVPYPNVGNAKQRK